MFLPPLLIGTRFWSVPWIDRSRVLFSANDGFPSLLYQRGITNVQRSCHGFIIYGMSWELRPTLLSDIRNDSYYLFVDESGSIHDWKACRKLIKSGTAVDARDQTFLLNGIFMSGTECKKVKKSFSRMKTSFFGRDDFPFHAKEMGSSTDGRYYDIGALKLLDLKNKISSLLFRADFQQISVFCNKQRLFSGESGDDPKACVREIYKQFFLLAEKKTRKAGKAVTVVFEASSSPTLDRMVLDVFIGLRRERLLYCCKRCYFSTKRSENYPAGLEVADLTAAPIFGLAKHPYSLVLYKHAHFTNLGSGDICVLKYPK